MWQSTELNPPPPGQDVILRRPWGAYVIGHRTTRGVYLFYGLPVHAVAWHAIPGEAGADTVSANPADRLREVLKR